MLVIGILDEQPRMYSADMDIWNFEKRREWALLGGNCVTKIIEVLKRLLLVYGLVVIPILFWRLLAHLSYNSDLAPWDSHLFPALNKYLGGMHFDLNEDVMTSGKSVFPHAGHSYICILNFGKHNVLSRYVDT